MACIPAICSDGCILAREPHGMVGISIRWREGAFACEFHANGAGGMLLMLRDGEVIHREAVASVAVASERAHELSRQFDAPRAKHA